MPQPDLFKKLPIAAAIISAAIAAGLGIAGIAGWMFHIALLKSILPGLAEIKFNTAAAFVFMGTALALLSTGAGRRRSGLFYFCIFSSMLLGGLTLFEYASGINLGIDEFIFKDDSPFLPGRMSPATALCFTLTGISMLILPRHRTTGRILNGFVFSVSLLALFGYAYGIIPFEAVMHAAGMALPTAAGFLILSFGIFMLEPEDGFVKIAFSKTGAGKMLRILLPASFLLPLVLGWLRVHGARLGLISEPFSMAVAMTLTAFLMAFLVCWMAGKLYQLESEREKLQRQFVLVEKMSAVAQLAAGFAHEVNNPLTVIVGYSHLLKEQFPDDSFVKEAVRHIDLCAFRLKNLVQQVLEFSNQTPAAENVLLNLNEVIESILPIAVPKASHIQVHADFDKKIPPVNANKKQLQQVFAILTKNAIDAMPSGGKLWVRTRQEKFNDFPCVVLEVEDTGIGIPPEHRSKVFDPFFTTKGPDKGTGIGLSVAQEIVRRLGGTISFKSEAGKGTSFLIYLKAESLSAPKHPDNPTKTDKKDSPSRLFR